MIITIDGPMASGKSTTAYRLAHELTFFYLNSGFLFRGLAYAILKISHHFGRSQFDVNAVDFIGLLPRLSYANDASSGARILFDHVDITSELKDPEVATLASMLGTDLEVRSALAVWQQELVRGKDSIVEGRDAGSVVFADAEAKIFLTARPEIRAARWQREQAARGNNISFQEALEAVNTRDERDSNRKIAPLIVPQGAIIIDNSELSLNETMAEIKKQINILQD